MRINGIKYPVVCLFLIVLFCSCTETDQLGPAPVSVDYENQINEWKEYRIDVLTGPTNWLRLHGIYWLAEGKNTFGSGNEQDVTFPEGTIPNYAGSFLLDDGIITMRVADEVTITHESESVNEMVIFDGENRPHLEHGDLEWFVDTRGNSHGIRLYNKDNPKADAFEGFPAYPLNVEWHLHARFVPNQDSLSITVDNVLGEEVERTSPGNIEFLIDGTLYSVIALEANSGLFIMFADETNRTETYHAGRYMIIPFPDENNMTILDFNKAYNPPCAFNQFTTCLLPPSQNRLEVPIEAGEKRPIGWDGI
ncbi:MAG: DUF1684 domain-containing protein [Balneolaceae bacterium]|nr:MAG: DUF1684 domain-containing protein [Balneolaceae bacterium]